MEMQKSPDEQMRDENIPLRKNAGRKITRRKNAETKKCGQKNADEKISDEKMPDEKRSWNPPYHFLQSNVILETEYEFEAILMNISTCA